MLLPDTSLPWEIIDFGDGDFSLASEHTDEKDDDAGTVMECLHSNGEGVPCGEVDAEYIVQSANAFPTMTTLLSEAAELLDQFDNGPDFLAHAIKIRDFLTTLQ